MKFTTKLLTVIFLCIANMSFAQKEIQECGTEPFTEEEKAAQPWYGNNQYLYGFSYISKK